MLRQLLMGTAAGAVGTVALNVATYADMAIRGRPSSSVPAKMAGVLADKAGLPLSAGGEGSDDEKVQNRQSGLGALFGYVTGLGVGTAYGLLRPHLRGVPMPVAGVGVGLAAMAASDIPIAALGVSDPTTWGGLGLGGRPRAAPRLRIGHGDRLRRVYRPVDRSPSLTAGNAPSGG